MPAPLHASFHLTYATMGVICWIEDLVALTVSHALTPITTVA